MPNLMEMRESVHSCTKPVHSCTKAVHSCTKPVHSCTFLYKKLYILVHFIVGPNGLPCFVHGPKRANCTRFVQECTRFVHVLYKNVQLLYKNVQLLYKIWQNQNVQVLYRNCHGPVGTMIKHQGSFPNRVAPTGPRPGLEVSKSIQIDEIWSRPVGSAGRAAGPS